MITVIAMTRALLLRTQNKTKSVRTNRVTLYITLSGRHKPLEIIRTLLEHGADINAKDDTNRTPVHVAAKYSNVKVMEYLLSHGGQVNKMDDCGLSPVHYAALHDNSGSGNPRVLLMDELLNSLALCKQLKHLLQQSLSFPNRLYSKRNISVYSRSPLI